MIDRFKKMSALVVVLVALIAARDASARTIYVSNVTGNDASNGRAATSTDIGGPVRTISRALAVCGPGDHIVVANTGIPYRESLSLSGGDQSGFVVLPFVIEGGGAVLDGTALIPDDAWQVARGDLYKFRPTGGGNLRLFQADGKPVPEVKLAPDARHLPQLEPGQWCERAGDAYFQCAFGKLPFEYKLSYAALPVGITLDHVHQVRIVDLTIQGFQRDGVNVHDGVREASLGGLTLRGNGRCGLYVGGSSQAIVEGCLIGDNGQAQIVVDGPSTLGLKGCNVLEATAPAIVRPRRGERVFVDGEEHK